MTKKDVFATNEALLAAQLHTARQRLSELELQVADLLLENARLISRLATATAASLEAENEKLRKTYDFSLGDKLVKDEATGRYVWQRGQNSA